jgi:hypothetical protein
VLCATPVWPVRRTGLTGVTCEVRCLAGLIGHHHRSDRWCTVSSSVRGERVYFGRHAYSPSSRRHQGSFQGGASTPPLWPGSSETFAGGAPSVCARGGSVWDQGIASRRGSRKVPSGGSWIASKIVDQCFWKSVGRAAVASFFIFYRSKTGYRGCWVALTNFFNTHLTFSLCFSKEKKLKKSKEAKASTWKQTKYLPWWAACNC